MKRYQSLLRASLLPCSFVFVNLLKLYGFGKSAGLPFTSYKMPLVTAGTILLIMCWTLVLQGNARRFSLWGLSLLLSVLIYGDLLYYRYFGDFITVPVLLQAGQLSALGGSIVSLMKWTDVLFFADIVLIGPLYFLLKDRHTANHPRLPWRWRIAASLLVGMLGFILVYAPIQHYQSKWGNHLFVNNWWNLSIYHVTGLLGFHYWDTQQYIKEHVWRQPTLTEEAEQEVLMWFDHHRRKQILQHARSASHKGYHVLLVQMEAFQSFVIGRTINGKAITPNLNRLMSEAAYFDKFYAQVGQGRTADAEFVVNAGLYPLPTGAVYRRYPHHHYDTLPELLKDSGYALYAFHAYDKSFWNRHVMYKQYGIDHYYGKEDFQPGETVGWALGDEPMLQQMVDILKRETKPFYAMAVLLSSHHPFTNVPARYADLDVGALSGTLEGRYLQAVHYVDYAIGRLVQRLKEDKLWHRTVVVIYGDHDAGLSDYKGLGKMLGYDADELTSVREKHQVPLFLHLPASGTSGIQQETAGMIDIAPTLLDSLGIPYADSGFMGTGLFRETEKIIVLRNGSFTDGELFYQSSPDGRFDRGRCYELKSGKLTDVSRCSEGYHEALTQLRISDRLIQHDLLKKMKKVRSGSP